MSQQLTLVQMNDSHAYLDLHPELFHARGQTVYRPAGGYARIATLLRQIRQEAPGRVLFLDGGDTFHGTFPAVHTHGRALLPILTALAPAAMTAHWEFAYTPAGFQSLLADLPYPMLALNVYRQADDRLLFDPYRVFEVGGLRVGVIGIASNIVDKTMPPHFSQGLYFTDGRAELPAAIAALRQQAHVDLVVLLSHLGFPQDVQLVSEVPGVDVNLSAHTHHRLEHAFRQGDTLVTQAGSHGAFLTRLDLEIDGGRVVDFTHRLIEVSEAIDPDPTVADLVTAALAPFQEELNQVVGATRRPLDRGRSLESTLDNLLLAAIQARTGAQLAFSNGWRYGAPIVPGPIRLNDLYNMAPMNPPVATVELRGDELRAMLEENLEHTLSRDPWRQMGGYLKRAAGLKAYFKIENPPQDRIVKLFVGEQEVRPDGLYTAAFVTEQGVPAKYGQNRAQGDDQLVPVLRDYLARVGPLEIGLHEPFVPV